MARTWRRLALVVLVLAASVVLAGCPTRSPITVSAWLQGLPRTGAVVNLIVDLRSVTAVDDARVEVAASDGLEIHGTDGSWQGSLIASERVRHLVEVRIKNSGVHVIQVYAHKSGDGAQFGDGEEVWIRSWKMIGFEVPQFVMRDRYGRLRFPEAAEALRETP
jgi:hypothetical protein